MIESKEPEKPATLPGMLAPQPEKQFWTYAELAKELLVTKQTLMEWVKRGKVPSPNYYSFTSRFTRDQRAQILAGPKPDGSYAVAASPRAEIARKAHLAGSTVVVVPTKKPTTPKPKKRLGRDVKKTTPKPKTKAKGKR